MTERGGLPANVARVQLPENANAASKGGAAIDQIDA
jgi:hypothetical protein